MNFKVLRLIFLTSYAVNKINTRRHSPMACNAALQNSKRCIFLCFWELLSSCQLLFNRVFDPSTPSTRKGDIGGGKYRGEGGGSHLPECRLTRTLTTRANNSIRSKFESMNLTKPRRSKQNLILQKSNKVTFLTSTRVPLGDLDILTSGFFHKCLIIFCKKCVFNTIDQTKPNMKTPEDFDQIVLVRIISMYP